MIGIVIMRGGWGRSTRGGMSSVKTSEARKGVGKEMRGLVRRRDMWEAKWDYRRLGCREKGRARSETYILKKERGREGERRRKKRGKRR